MSKDTWQWWAGSSDETYEVGPFDSKQDALDEALGQYCFEEIEVDGQWHALVYVAEHKGTYYDCDECGVVETACAECRECLNRYEPYEYFWATRNAESARLPYPYTAARATVGAV